MKKAILFAPLLLVLAVVSAPNAKADSISFFGGFTAPSDPSISISGTDAITLGSVMDAGFTFTFTNLLQASSTPYSDSFSWTLYDFSFFGAEAFVLTDNTTGSSVSASLGNGGYDFFIDSGCATISGTSATAPEPGTVALLLVGIGLLFAMRKRIARSAMQAV
jgi:hypothetical protein